MLCQGCVRRQSCSTVCGRLAADLRSREVAQREMNLTPEVVAKVADHALFSLADLQPDRPWPWDTLADSFPELSAEEIEIFLRRYYDRMPVREIAGERGLHRVTVSNKLRHALAIVCQGHDPAWVVRTRPAKQSGADPRKVSRLRQRKPESTVRRVKLSGAAATKGKGIPEASRAGLGP